MCSLFLHHKAKMIPARALAEAQRLQKYIGKGNAFLRTKELAMGSFVSGDVPAVLAT